MGDAEIIPIGTRGKPGRGTGDEKPSSNSRSLAAKAPARRPAGQADRARPPPSRARTTSACPPRSRAEPRTPKPPPRQLPDVALDRLGRPGRRDARSCPGDHRPPPPRLPGIPPLEWLAALTSASKELFGDNWEPRLAEFLAFLRRRLTGDYTVDDYGFDQEITERFMLTALRPIAQKWFRVEVRGAENIPADGWRAGRLQPLRHGPGRRPDDRGQHPRPHRPVPAPARAPTWSSGCPFVSDLARKGGATLACNEDAERMLRGGELVGVWPEGFKGIGKPFSERYKLQRFGRGGFVSAAIRTGVPIIPTSVVGAEEIYPLVGNIPSLARLLGIPYLPITPLFPLLGPLGLIPLPSKWLIEFGEPIRTDDYDVGAADDPMLVFNVTDQVRESIQQTLYSLLMKRSSVFS